MALGSVGWIMPGVKPSNGNFYSYRYHTDRGGLFLPDKRYGIPVPHLQEASRAGLGGGRGGVLSLGMAVVV